jgi:hypothetical protein
MPWDAASRVAAVTTEEEDRRSPVGDDRVIGRAMWWSVAVAAAVGGAVVAWRAWPRPVPAAPAAAPLPTGPSAVRPPVEVPPVPFEDVTAAWGIDFDRVDGADGRRFLPETMGGGVGIADVDADGDLDLLLVDGDAWPDAPAGARRGTGIATYVNRGANASPRFARAAATGLERAWAGMGLALADLDGDGRPEILATGVGGVRLFASDPTAPSDAPRWRDATAEAGLGSVGGWTTAAGFADLDRDGDLDLVLGRYVEWTPEIDLRVGSTLTGIGRAYGAPTGFEGADLSYLEQVAPMRFEDRSRERGFVATNPSTGRPLAKALGLVIDDLDGDSDLDVFVANDTVQNLLFANDGSGRFTERGVEAGVAFDRGGAATGAMGCDAARLRGDGSLAIAVGNFANEPASLYVTRDGRRFDDDAIVEGISAATRPTLAFGVAFADLDADGREDLVLANGHIEPRIREVQSSQSYAQPAQAFWNTGGHGGPVLAEVPAAGLGALAAPAVGRGLAWADLDDDGRLDLVIGTVSGAPRVLRNAAPGGRAVSVRLVDGRSPGNREAIGARVVLRAGGGAQSRTLMPTRSYLSQVPAQAWFGLGPVDGPATIEVTWPDGSTSSHPIEPGARGEVEIRR